MRVLPGSRRWPINRFVQEEKKGNNMENGMLSVAGKIGAAWVVMLRDKAVDVVWYNKGLSAKTVWTDLVYTHGFSVDVKVIRPS